MRVDNRQTGERRLSAVVAGPDPARIARSRAAAASSPSSWPAMRVDNRQTGEGPSIANLHPETSAKERVSGAARVLRWVPDSLPLRCAPLQASGKGLLRGSRQSLHGFPGRMQRKRNATRDPAQNSAAKRRQTHFAEVSSGSAPWHEGASTTPRPPSSSRRRTVDDRQTRAAIAVRGGPSCRRRPTPSRGSATPPFRAGHDARLLPRSGGGGPPKAVEGARTRTVKGQGRRPPSDQPHGAPATVRVAPPPPCFAWFPSPASRERISRHAGRSGALTRSTMAASRAA